MKQPTNMRANLREAANGFAQVTVACQRIGRCCSCVSSRLACTNGSGLGVHARRSGVVAEENDDALWG
jgi:positive regulator of sigma E activity